MRIVFLAPPGAGKGTQGALICQHYGIVQLSTGEILRKNKGDGTELGEKAKAYMDKGDLVPDDLMIEMIKTELDKEIYSKGYILDGFPRTVPQAEALDTILSNFNQNINAVIILKVNKEELIRRLSARRTCRTCGKTFHLIFDPPEKSNQCDNCGGELYQRIDDRPETILNRLKIFHDRTSPLINYYGKKGLVSTVKGTGKTSEVFERIEEILDPIKSEE